MRDALSSLRRLTRQVRLYPAGHPLTQEALSLGLEAFDRLGSGSDATINLFQNAFYFNGELLPHLSLEYSSLYSELASSGVESFSLAPPTQVTDLYDFASLVAGVGGHLPAGGSIRFNESGVSTTSLVESPVAGLRSSYGGALDAVRSATGSLADGESIEMATVARSVESIVDSSVQQSGAALLLATVKSHDEYTYFHSVNACIMAVALGRLLGIDKADLVPIGVGSLLHDIGKIAVSAKVLQHPGRLDDAMWKEIQLHPQEGAQAIMAAGGPGHELAATIAFEHHARFDGSGYPSVARRARPHLFSRLVAVSDTYDAITTRRSYRRAETPNRALSVLLSHIGGSYDPDLVRAFIKMMGVYPPGSILELKSGVTVMVTHMEEEQEIEAHGVVVKGADGVPLESPEPLKVHLDDVVAQVLPEVAGVDPAAMLEKIAQFVKV